MKVALITDTHWGARADSTAFNEFFFRFWEETFFPYIIEQKITHIVHLGDVVDRRKFINYATLHSLRTRFVDRIRKMPVTMYVLVGNHDVPYRNTNEVNAVEELFGHSDNIHIVSEAQDITLGNLPVALIPWINASNFKSTTDFMDKSPAQIAMGHLEVAGFEMDRGNICYTGMQRESFKKFETVYTGHFHHKSTDGHIFYLGNTYEITWADYNDKRGFHILDTETRELEFIENPYRMFHKIVYNDETETLETVAERDWSIYHNVMVKVVVAVKTNLVLFDHFMDALYKVQPLDVTIVEDFTEYNSLNDDDIVDQSDDTITILDKYIDGVELGLDKPKLKNILREIYIEAQNLETL